jgi:sirohydrochlorin ferrochelatase
MSDQHATPSVSASLRATDLHPDRLAALGLDSATVGVVIVDHGSRRNESNELLLQVAALFRQTTALKIVEPAHMELAEPSIATAFARAVQQGAQLVVVHPYFLAPGRHWRDDIPQLAAAAAARHPGLRYLVTAPLGLHPLMQQIMQDRILHCLQHALQGTDRCDVCVEGPDCQLRTATGE